VAGAAVGSAKWGGGERERGREGKRTRGREKSRKRGGGVGFWRQGKAGKEARRQGKAGKEARRQAKKEPSQEGAKPGHGRLGQ